MLASSFFFGKNVREKSEKESKKAKEASTASIRSFKSEHMNSRYLEWGKFIRFGAEFLLGLAGLPAYLLTRVADTKISPRLCILSVVLFIFGFNPSRCLA